MEDLKKKAKLGVLGEIRGMASKLMQDGLGHKMQKVMVAAQDKEGLKEGLEKAKDILGDLPKKDEEMSEGNDYEESQESPEEESSEQESSDEMSVEDIEQQIKDLEEKKLALLKKA